MTTEDTKFNANPGHGVHGHFAATGSVSTPTQAATLAAHLAMSHPALITNVPKLTPAAIVALRAQKVALSNQQRAAHAANVAAHVVAHNAAVTARTQAHALSVAHATAVRNAAAAHRTAAAKLAAQKRAIALRKRLIAARLRARRLAIRHAHPKGRSRGRTRRRKEIQIMDYKAENDCPTCRLVMIKLYGGNVGCVLHGSPDAKAPGRTLDDETVVDPSYDGPDDNDAQGQDDDESEVETCPKCGSTDVSEMDDEMLECNDCGNQFMDDDEEMPDLTGEMDDQGPEKCIVCGTGHIKLYTGEIGCAFHPDQKGGPGSGPRPNGGRAKLPTGPSMNYDDLARHMTTGHGMDSSEARGMSRDALDAAHAGTHDPAAMGMFNHTHGKSEKVEDTKGDSPGHVFRGNQWGSAGADAAVTGFHIGAAKNHLDSAQQHLDNGNARTAAANLMRANAHLGFRHGATSRIVKAQAILDSHGNMTEARAHLRAAHSILSAHISASVDSSSRYAAKPGEDLETSLGRGLPN